MVPDSSRRLLTALPLQNLCALCFIFSKRSIFQNKPHARWRQWAKTVTADLTYSQTYLHPAREQRIISLLLRLPPLTPASSECRSNQFYRTTSFHFSRLHLASCILFLTSLVVYSLYLSLHDFASLTISPLRPPIIKAVCPTPPTV